MVDEIPPVVVISGRSFQFYPLPCRKALQFNAAFEAIVIPVLGGIEGLDLASATFNFATAATGLSKALSDLDPDKHWSLLLALLYTTQYIPEAGKPVFLNSEAGMDAAFKGDISIVHQVCWEAMKANHFPFVELGSRFGALLKEIAGSKLGSKTTAKPSETSAASENSTQSS